MLLLIQETPVAELSLMTRSSTEVPLREVKRGVKNCWQSHVAPNLFYSWRQLQVNDVHSGGFLLALFCCVQAVPTCTACR